jgi:transcriptional regulator with XRE-family HTH domain
MFAPSPFGIMLKQAREDARLSQLDLSMELGKTAQYISNIEKGKNNSPPDDADLQILIAKLGLSAPEAEHFRFLAYADRGMLPPEMFNYVFNSPSLISLIRNAAEHGIDDEFWNKTLKNMNRKGI